MPRCDDLYPSRVGGEPELLPRRDPVLHGSPETSGPLSPDQLACFDRDGFIVLGSALSDAITQALLDESTRLRDAHKGSKDAAVIHEQSTGDVRSVFAVHETSPPFRELASHPLLLTAAMQILGGRVYVHQSRINYKPAFRGREFYWHSDFETWHVEDGMPRMRALSASISLLENNVLNGPLMLVPGSHRQYVACSGSTPERNYETSLVQQDYGVPEGTLLEELVSKAGVEAPVCKPGSVVLFDCNVMHGSNGNITPWPRTNVFLVYNCVDNALEAPFSNQPPRPDHIASRDFTPLENCP